MRNNNDGSSNRTRRKRGGKIRMIREKRKREKRKRQEKAWDKAQSKLRMEAY